MDISVALIRAPTAGACLIPVPLIIPKWETWGTPDRGYFGLFHLMFGNNIETIHVLGFRGECERSYGDSFIALMMAIRTAGQQSSSDGILRTRVENLERGAHLRQWSRTHQRSDQKTTPTAGACTLSSETTSGFHGGAPADVGVHKHDATTGYGLPGGAVDFMWLISRRRKAHGAREGCARWRVNILLSITCMIN
jgi:hypothetical protein